MYIYIYDNEMIICIYVYITWIFPPHNLQLFYYIKKWSYMSKLYNSSFKIIIFLFYCLIKKIIFSNWNKKNSTNLEKWLYLSAIRYYIKFLSILIAIILILEEKLLDKLFTK